MRNRDKKTNKKNMDRDEEIIGIMAYDTPEEKKKADEEMKRINHMIYGDNIPEWLNESDN